MITVGELLVKIGLKGSSETKDGLKQVSGGLTEVKSMSLEAKAAIAGVVYGFYNMISKSNELGRSLVNFNQQTGLSSETLQRWQYAGNKAAVSTDEVQSSIMALQAAMTELNRTGNAPATFGEILARAQDLGINIDTSREGLKDTFGLALKFQEVAKQVAKTVGPDYNQKLFGPTGLGSSFIGAMGKGAFNQKAFSGAQVVSDGQAKTLNQAYAQWSQLFLKIELLFAKFNSEHGAQLITSLTKMADQTFRVADGLMKIMSHLKVFEGLGKLMEWAGDRTKEVADDKSGPLVGWLKFVTKMQFGGAGAFDKPSKDPQKDLKEMIDWFETTGKALLKDATTPLPKNPHSDKVGANNVNVNVHNHEVTDIKRGAEYARNEYLRAFKQNPAQNQES